VTNGRRDLYGPANRYPFDLDPNAGQLLIDQLLPRPRNQNDLNVGRFNFAPRNRSLFDVKRNPQIFWLPLLIGHALLSNPAAHRMPWRSLADFSGMCG
jgi:hypothetical protein